MKREGADRGYWGTVTDEGLAQETAEAVNTEETAAAPEDEKNHDDAPQSEVEKDKVGAEDEEGEKEPEDKGCDASVLLNDTATFTGEQGAGPNVGSIRGFGVIDNIKAQVEAICKQTVSCADILAVAARDSVVALGGPSWTVPLGRRDSTTASFSLANSDLPPPSFDLANLIAAFANKGLSITDMVALSGAHTIGQAQCQNFRARIYNDTNINSAFATSLKANCPAASGPPGDNNLAPLDTTTPNAFDNAYYRNLLSQRGLLHSDQQLFNGGATDGQVRRYVSTPSRFNRDFAAAMVRMGNISPLTGTQGQIRLSCSNLN